MGPFKDFIVESGLEIPEEFKAEPQDHRNAFWQHLGGTKSKYTEIDDMHLINILFMIRRNIHYYEDVIKLENMNECAIEQLDLFRKQNAYASFEVHKRGLYVQNKEESTNV